MGGTRDPFCTKSVVGAGSGWLTSCSGGMFSGGRELHVYGWCSLSCRPTSHEMLQARPGTPFFSGVSGAALKSPDWSDKRCSDHSWSTFCTPVLRIRVKQRPQRATKFKIGRPPGSALRVKKCPRPAAPAGLQEVLRAPTRPRTRCSTPARFPGAMSKSCQGLLKDFVKCLRESDCMKVGRAVTAANWGCAVPLGRLAGWGLGWVSARAWSHRPGPCQTWQTHPPCSTRPRRR